MSNNIVQHFEGELRVSSESISAHVGGEHRAVLQLINAHVESLEEFGLVAFEMRARPEGQHGGGAVRVAHLNEAQATLLITFMRNTDRVIAFKVELVRQFQAMKQALAPVAPDLSSAQGVLEMAQMFAQAAGELVRAEAQIAELEPKAAHTDTMREADGLRTITDLTNDLKVHAATNHPGVKVLRDDLFDLAGVVGLIIRGNTVRHNQPTARAIEAGWVKPKDTKVDTNNHGSFVKVSARLTPRGYGRLWDAAVTNLKNYGQVLAPQKGIAA